MLFKTAALALRNTVLVVQGPYSETRFGWYQRDRQVFTPPRHLLAQYNRQELARRIKMEFKKDTLPVFTMNWEGQLMARFS